MPVSQLKSTVAICLGYGAVVIMTVVAMTYCEDDTGKLIAGGCMTAFGVLAKGTVDAVLENIRGRKAN